MAALVRKTPYLAFVLCCLFSCSYKNGGGNTSVSSGKNVLRVQLTTEPISLDPAEVEDGVGLRLITQLDEGLAGYDAQGHVLLQLAESFDVTQQGKHFEFKLKPGLKWSDGVSVQIQDFVFGIRRAIDPKAARHSADELKIIQSVKEENGRLVFDLKESTPYFLHILTLPSALPVREDVLNKNGGKWNVQNAPVTGPFQVANYDRGNHLLIERNPNYYGKQANLDGVDFLFIQDESTGLNLFDAGKLDVLTRVPVADVPRLRKTGLIHSDPYFATYFIGFNARKAPFQDPDFRRAFSAAIHRKELVEGLGTGDSPAHFWLPPGILGLDSYPASAATEVLPEILNASLKKVRGEIDKNPKLFDEAIAASFDSGARNSQIMEKIQNDILQELKLKISLTNLDWKSYVRSIQTDPTPIFRFGWQAAFADPMTFLNVFRSSSVNNYSGWKNVNYDRLVAEISKMVPSPERDQKIQDAQRILVETDAIIAPIFHYVQNHLVAKRVSGFQVNPFAVVSFKDIKLKGLEPPQ
ncbi:unnamed protein product [Sphagnum jensenii]|uniref:Solute-binding protein family 5 domain-containing protein n=1 Tax=Sphagnum jensenii TaxID=128206 RepID=A0ABP0V9U1_9BRYO